MPNTGSPKRIRPISVPQAGMPEMNDLVPSIGSSTQTYSASVRSDAVFLAEDAVVREERRMRARMACSAARSAAVTGSKPPGLLVLDRERRAEERQDGVARNAGELVDEAREIDNRHGAPACFSFDLSETGCAGNRGFKPPADPGRGLQKLQVSDVRCVDLSASLCLFGND